MEPSPAPRIEATTPRVSVLLQELGHSGTGQDGLKKERIGAVSLLYFPCTRTPYNISQIVGEVGTTGSRTERFPWIEDMGKVG